MIEITINKFAHSHANSELFHVVENVIHMFLCDLPKPHLRL